MIQYLLRNTIYDKRRLNSGIKNRRNFFRREFFAEKILRKSCPRIYGFAYTNVKKSILDPKILELVGDIGIILNDFQS